jgi:hypothetical protein
MSGAFRDDGFISADLVFDVVTEASFNDLMTHLHGGVLTVNASRAAMALSRGGYYGAYLVEFGSIRDYAPRNSGFYAQVRLSGTWTLQLTELSTSEILTLEQRFVEVDTTAGNRTETLPAASTVNVNTGYTFIKKVAANTLLVAAAGGDTISGVSVSLTNKGQWLVLFSDGVSDWTSPANYAGVS